MEARCRILSDNWLNSLEKACVGVMSPTGKTVWIRKANMLLLSQEQREFVWHLIVLSHKSMYTLLSVKDMKKALEISNIK